MKVLGITREQKLRSNIKMRIEHKTKCSFKTWKELYIIDYKPNLTELIINEVVKDRMIVINLLGLFNIAEELDGFADYLRQTLMLEAYTGKSQQEKLKWLIKFNFEHGCEKTRQIILNESLA